MIPPTAIANVKDNLQGREVIDSYTLTVLKEKLVKWREEGSRKKFISSRISTKTIESDDDGDDRSPYA